MKSSIELNSMDTSLRAKVRKYKKLAQEIEGFLLKNPHEWGRFQSDFNVEINGIFRDIMNFEKENIAAGKEERVYKLKRFFINKIRSTFVRGDYISWSLQKPFGYAGDFQIIEDIYKNYPQTTGFSRLFDNYFMTSAISTAVRNRKDDFKRMITDIVRKRKKNHLQIMNLASGPCKEIREMMFNEMFNSVIFDCYDNDENGIKFASAILSNYQNINFIKENAMRIAFRKDIHSLINKKYDIIYSTGLFDYFEERIAVRLIEKLKLLLNPEGLLIISDVRDKYSNPSVHFMEWVGDWNLVYRDDDSFRNIFLKAGFNKNDLEFRYEQQGILQYIIALKN